MAIDKDLASGETVGSQSPFDLFAGEADVITEEAVLDTGNLAKYTVVGRLTASGKIVAFDSTADTGAENAIGILTQAADASSGDKNVAIYTGGFFNHSALVWDSPTNTLALRQAAFRASTGHSIRIGSVRL
jgi:hypothetical protein